MVELFKKLCLYERPLEEVIRVTDSSQGASQKRHRLYLTVDIR
jgi:hypothetical protein